MLSDDLLFFGKPGRTGARRPFQVGYLGTGINRDVDPHAVDAINAHYDPSDTAACWRLVTARIKETDEYKELTSLIEGARSVWYNARMESLNSAVNRFRNAISIYDAPVVDRSQEKADFWASNMTKSRIRDINVLLTKESELWGVDRKVLAGVTLGDCLLRLGTIVDGAVINAIAKKIGAKQAIYRHPTPNNIRHKKGLSKKRSFRKPFKKSAGKKRGFKKGRKKGKRGRRKGFKKRR